MPVKKPTETVVIDFHIPFWRMVAIMVKLSFAAIPAAFIFTLIFVLVNFVLGGLLAGTMALG